jgi:hypothetical protein
MHGNASLQSPETAIGPNHANFARLLQHQSVPRRAVAPSGRTTGFVLDFRIDFQKGGEVRKGRVVLEKGENIGKRKEAAMASKEMEAAMDRTVEEFGQLLLEGGSATCERRV